MKVQLIQYDIAWMNPDRNIEIIENELSMSEADLIVLPEMFLTGFNMDAAATGIPVHGDIWNKLILLSNNHPQFICGSIAVEEKGKYYNRAILFHQGDVIHSYDKNYLFSFSGEDNEYTPGSAANIIEIMGWKIALQVCYDLRFPESIRSLDEVDMIIYMANWPEARIDHWQKLLMARAIENQCYVIGCNRVGIDGNEWKCSGNSMIVDFSGKVMMSAGIKKMSLISHLSLSDMKAYRNKYPFLKDKK